MTQPSEFEQVVETLQLATWQSDILSIAHNADTAAQVAAAERRVLGQLKPYLEKYEFTGDPIVGKFNELAALSGQGPAKPCPKCGMPDPDHTPDDPRHMSDEEWAKMSKPAPHVEHFIDVAQRVVAEKPTNPCKTCNGSGRVGDCARNECEYCPDCGGTGVAK